MMADTTEIFDLMGDVMNLIRKVTTENDRLRTTLQSIAQNTCCNGCQEAGLIAKHALAYHEDP